MKNQFLLLVVAFVVLVNPIAEAQVKSNVIKTSLTAPILKTYTLAYEHAFNSDISAQLGFNYFAGWKIGDSRLNGFSVTPEFRYYLSESKEAPRGGFIAPFARYGSTGIKAGVIGDEDYGKADITLIGGAFL